MKEVELRYWPIGKEVPEGWELVADFDNCHHGRYSQGIIRRVSDGRGEDVRAIRANDNQSHLQGG